MNNSISCYTSALRFAPWPSANDTSAAMQDAGLVPCFSPDGLTYYGDGYSGFDPQSQANPELWVPSIDDSSVCQRSKCFANRSAILFEWKRYEDCLREIERAMDAAYPKELVWLLLYRKAKCAVEVDRLPIAYDCSATLKCLAARLEGSTPSDSVIARSPLPAPLSPLEMMNYI